MNKYDVHIYVVVRVKLESVEASGQREAIAEARKQFEEEGIGRRLGLTLPVHATHAEYADEVVRYLVDEQGDNDYERTRSYEAADLDEDGARQAHLTSTVDPDWKAMVCEWVDLFRTDHCGYWLRAIAREQGLGCLAWEDDEQHDFTKEPHLDEALAAWKEGQPLPEGYHRLDAEFARRSWAEGVKMAGELWYEEGDAARYDIVMQHTLFGKLVYG